MEEELKKKLSDLYIKKEDIDQKIYIHQLNNLNGPCPKALMNMLNEITVAIEYYEAKLFALDNKPELSDGNIELYLTCDNEFYSNYIIFLCNTNTYIGKILYQKNLPKSHKEHFGNISYEIFPKHRGNHYALESLNLISDKLYKNGVTEIYIAAEKDNLPSIKTIENFGGQPIISNVIMSYKCDLNEIKNKHNKH